MHLKLSSAKRQSLSSGLALFLKFCLNYKILWHVRWLARPSWNKILWMWWQICKQLVFFNLIPVPDSWSSWSGWITEDPLVLCPHLRVPTPSTWPEIPDIKLPWLIITPATRRKEISLQKSIIWEKEPWLSTLAVRPGHYHNYMRVMRRSASIFLGPDSI